MGMCSTGIDFQLGTNAADSIGSKWVKQTLDGKRLKSFADFAWRSVWLSLIGSDSDRRSVKLFSWRRLSVGFTPGKWPKRLETVHSYNRVTGTCAH